MRRRTSNPERPTEQIERIERVERVERVERQKAKRSDKRSLDLFRQRDRLMAEAKLEDAVKAISTQSGLLLSGRCATSSSTASSLKRHRTWSAGDGHSAEQAKSTGGRWSPLVGTSDVSTTSRLPLSSLFHNGCTSEQNRLDSPDTTATTESSAPRMRATCEGKMPSRVISNCARASGVSGIDGVVVGRHDGTGQTSRGIGRRSEDPVVNVCGRTWNVTGDTVADGCDDEKQSFPPRRREEEEVEKTDVCPTASLPEVDGSATSLAKKWTAPSPAPSKVMVELGGEPCLGKRVVTRYPQTLRGEQPAFVVAGLVGTVQKRVLLLPTCGRRRDTLGNSSAQSGESGEVLASARTRRHWYCCQSDGGNGSGSNRQPAVNLRKSSFLEGTALNKTNYGPVILTWGEGTSRERLLLTRTKGKPHTHNPLLALANALAWTRELGPCALPTDKLPFLPRQLATAPPSPVVAHAQAAAMRYSNTFPADTGHLEGKGSMDKAIVHGGQGECDAVGLPRNPRPREETHAGGDRTHPARRTLSVGASWMLAHLVVGQHGGHPSGGAAMTGVGKSGAEAAALSLLSCPDIGWAPEPEQMQQALVDGGGTLCGYVASAVEPDSEDRLEPQGGLGRAACEELIDAKLCVRSDDGGRIRLHDEVEMAFDLCLAIFAGHWRADREMLAGTALGLIQTGLTTRGIRPRPMRSLLVTPKQSWSESCDGVGDRTVVDAGRSGGRMSGRVGELCVQLHTWCLKVRRGLGSADERKHLLWQLQKSEVVGDDTFAQAWNGPMAEALGLLGGGWDRDGLSSGTIRSDWVARLSKGERLLDRACFLLKQSIAEVVEVLCGIVGSWQKKKSYKDAVVLLRLILRHDRNLAGRMYSAAPDLQWAAEWCTSRFRGWAWIRLSINLEHCAEHRGCLDALRCGYDDEHVRGGDRVEIRDRLSSKNNKYGDPEDTPPASPLRKHSEEQFMTDMKTGKEGNERSTKGGRLLFFDTCSDTARNIQTASVGRRKKNKKRKGALVVEEVVLRDKRVRGGWAGLHCESHLVVWLMMLLLWEDMFDENVHVASGHCLTNRPSDLYDHHFSARRKGLAARLRVMAGTTDQDLWVDVDRRYERYKGVECSRCSWRLFTKQQVMETAVAFGGRRLSYVFKALANDFPHLSHGFPDLVLWRPKGHAGGGEPEKGWSGQEFGLGWDGKGKGWDVQVVEVKSPTDTLSHSQRAWISLLRDAGVPATVSRVLHC